MALKDLIPSSKKGVPMRRDEENPFAVLRREVDSIFDSFFRGFDLEPFWGETRLRTFNPRVDVSETEKEIAISAELPGLDEKDIDVSINRDSLTIKGEKKEEKEEKGKGYYQMERSYGSFSRTIPLPAEIDMDKIDASFKKGVLTVRVPKTAKAIEETKKITVKTE